MPLNMKILIVDDEPLACTRLRALIEELAIGKVVAEASNGKEAIMAARLHQPDVVLLDVRMPGINGMEVAAQLTTPYQKPIIIFVTAYGEYALEAFEQQAIDYLLKPVRKERLEQALIKAYRILQTSPIRAADLPKPTARTHISVYIRGELRLIPVSQIYYFLANQKYVVLHWKQGEILVSEALKDLEQEFAGQFLRLHRSVLVATVHIASLYKTPLGQSYIKLREVDKSLEVSRRHLAIVKKVLKDMRIPGSS